MYNFSDEKLDFNPKSWLSKFHRTSVPYLIQMAVFYSIFGIVLQIIGNNLVQHVIPDYQGPSLPYSLIIGLTAGPVEEILFFGLPFYVSGNPHLILATGMIWSIAHILNTEVFEITNLAYGNFLFTIPHIFFSLRTWLSGKGWFAITFHSAWNLTFLVPYCISNNSCIPIGDGWYFLLDIISIISAGILLVITYKLYQRKQSKS